MTIMSDRWITRMAREHGMIEPYEDRQVRKGRHLVRRELVRLRHARRARLPDLHERAELDRRSEDSSIRSRSSNSTGDVCIVPPNSFALASSVEYFRIPRNILTVTVGKSTYARCGIITNVTPFEPEWEGYVTLEISNTTPLPAKIYANEGIAQVLFFRGEEEPRGLVQGQGRQVPGAGGRHAAEALAFGGPDGASARTALPRSHGERYGNCTECSAWRTGIRSDEPGQSSLLGTAAASASRTAAQPASIGLAQPARFELSPFRRAPSLRAPSPSRP